jgi:spore coat protein U-like protein
MKKFLLLTAIASVASVAAVAPAMAVDTLPGTITVNAGTAASCTQPSNVTVSLGNYNGTAAVAATAATVSFKCTLGTPATVAFSSVSTSSATGGTLLGGNASLPATPIAYTYTTNVPVTVGTGLIPAATALTATASVAIAAGQNPTVGSYTDDIKVTVSY